MLERIGETRKAIAHGIGSFTDSVEESWRAAKQGVVTLAVRVWAVLLQGMKSIPGLARRIWSAIVGLLKSLGSLAKRAWNTIVQKTRPFITTAFLVGAILLILGLLVGLYRLLMSGGTIEEFHANVSTELISIGITVVIIDTLNEFRQDQQLKAQLIRDMSGQVNDFSLRAVRELSHHKWLYDGSLEGADLARANLRGAELWIANLRGANLRSANLEGADLRLAKLERAEYDDYTKWPKGFDPEEAGAKYIETEE